MENYLHVVLKVGEKSFICLYSDLSKKELKKKFIKPFQKGEDFFNDGSVIISSQIAKVIISSTQNDLETTLKDYKEKSTKEIIDMNKMPGISYIASPKGLKKSDIKDCGENVTEKFINKAPKRSHNSLYNFSHNPWIVGIGVGIILLFIAWLIFKYFGIAL